MKLCCRPVGVQDGIQLLVFAVFLDALCICLNGFLVILHLKIVIAFFFAGDGQFCCRNTESECEEEYERSAKKNYL